MKIYNKENGEIGIKSIRSYIEVILAYFGLQPQSFLIFLDYLKEEDFQEGTREASYQDLVSFISFFTEVSSDYLATETSKIADKQCFLKEFKCLLKSSYNFKDLDKFYRKYYSHLLPDTGSISMSTRFVELLNYFETCFNYAVENQLLLTRPIGNISIPSSYCHSVLSNYFNCINELESVVANDISDECVNLIQVIEYDIAKLNLKKNLEKTEMDEVNQLLQNSYFRMPQILKPDLVMDNESSVSYSLDQHPTPCSLDQATNFSNVHNLPDLLQPIPVDQIKQSAVDSNQQALKIVNLSNQSDSQLSLKDYLTCSNNSQASISSSFDQEFSKTANLSSNVQSSLMSSLRKNRQESNLNSLIKHSVPTCYYDYFDLNPQIKSSILSALNRYRTEPLTSQRLEKIPMPFNLPPNLKSSLISTLTGSSDQSVFEDAYHSIQHEQDSALNPFENDLQPITFQSEQASVLPRFVEQSSEFLRKGNYAQWQQDPTLIQSNQLAESQQVYEIELNQQSTSYQNEQNYIQIQSNQLATQRSIFSSTPTFQKPIYVQSSEIETERFSPISSRQQSNIIIIDSSNKLQSAYSDKVTNEDQFYSILSNPDQFISEINFDPKDDGTK